MRRFAITFVVIPVLLLLSLTACSGSDPSNTAVTAVTTINITPTTISMNKGDVLQLSPVARSASGGAVAADFTFTSSNSSLLSITPAGLMCAGTWDPKFAVGIACLPATTSGTSDITITAQSVSVVVKAYVHAKVDIVEVDDVPACVSMGETTQLTASSFTKDAATCAALGAAVPCKLPASTVGPYSWFPTETAVVTIDNTSSATNGVATAGVPGLTGFYAAQANNHSATKNFIACPITSISITVKDSTAAPFTYAKAATKSLVAVVKDSAGKTLDGSKTNASNVVVNAPPISWINSQPLTSTAVVTSATATNTATGTAVNPGPGLFLATCTPTTCNLHLPPVFSNPIVATVSGTSNATIYAASTSSTTLIPIDAATNTAGTAITLPRIPNSMVVNSLGTKLLLGADSGGVMLVDTTSNAITSASFFGKVIGISPDGVHGFVFDSTHKAVFVLNVTTGAVDQAILVTGTATSADATPDGTIYFVVVDNLLYSFDATQGQRNTTLPGIGNEVAVLASGPAVYTPIKTGNIQARATCQPATVVDTQTAGAPTNVKAMPNGDGAVVVDSPNLIVLHNVNLGYPGLPGSACPFRLSESRTAVDLQGGAFTSKQLLVTPDATLAFVTNDTGKLLSYNISTATVKPITLGGSATASYTMSSTMDSKFVYVGASDGTVHKIDTTTMTDAQQIAVALKKADATNANPDLVVVRNKP